MVHDSQPLYKCISSGCHDIGLRLRDYGWHTPQQIRPQNDQLTIKQMIRVQIESASSLGHPDQMVWPQYMQPALIINSWTINSHSWTVNNQPPTRTSTINCKLEVASNLPGICQHQERCSQKQTHEYRLKKHQVILIIIDWQRIKIMGTSRRENDVCDGWFTSNKNIIQQQLRNFQPTNNNHMQVLKWQWQQGLGVWTWKMFTQKMKGVHSHDNAKIDFIPRASSESNASTSTRFGGPKFLL